MNYTTNYNLNKPEPAEQYNIAHWNENSDTLDRVIKEEVDTRISDVSDLNDRIDNEETARANGVNDAKNLANATGILDVTHGGTGGNSKTNAINNLCSDIQSSTINNADELLFQKLNGGAKNLNNISLSDFADKIYLLIQNRISTATLPIGIPLPFCGDFGTDPSDPAHKYDKVPLGFLACDGQEVSRTQYADLFAVIGTKYGNGDEINTFNVPDFRGRHLEGASAVNAVGTHLEAGLPNITGVMGKISSSNIVGSGCFSREAGTETYETRGSQGNNATVNFNATNGETKTDGTLKTANEHHVYGASDTVQPDSVCVNFIIKY